MLKRISLMSLCLILSAVSGYGQGVQAETSSPESKQEVTISEEGRVSLDFRDADIRNVFKILAYKSGVNIVASPEVSGAVSIQLSNVPWQQALDVILQTYGYAYERKGNIIVVTTVENLKQRREDAMLLAEQEPMMTRTFVLNFGKASEIITSVEKMKSERGNIDFDERTNTIIVTDIEEKISLISAVIDTLDSTTPQVLIEAKIVETKFDDKENFGIDWVTQASLSGSSTPISWPFKKGATQSRFAPDTFASPDSEEFSFGTLNFIQTQAIFEALKTKTDTNILSNPRVVTLDNQSAKIIVGSQYPIPTYTYNEEQARLQVSGWEYKDIGIIFEVTPHVNSAGFVTLEIEPQITAIIGSVTVENTELPELSNESTKTSVMIKDGETLVIAGLIKSNTSKTKKSVPFLGDIPILGYAFQKNDETVSKQDIIIFITPHIITPEIPS